MRFLLDSTGTPTHTLNYDPYGVPLPVPGQESGIPSALGFTGEQTDPLGLVNLRARTYNPRWGAFTSVDPVLGVGGSTGWNGYLYANGNPANFTDPSGEFAFLPVLFFIASAALSTGSAFAAYDVFVSQNKGLLTINSDGLARNPDAFNFSNLHWGRTADRFVRGTVLGGSVAFGGLSALAAPGAALAYAAATGAYTVGRDLLDTIDAAPWLKGAVDMGGILTGMAFIREDLHILGDPNVNGMDKLQAFGDIFLNGGFGGSLFSGLSKAGHSVRLTRELALAEGQAAKQLVLERTLSRMTGQNVSILVEGSGFYRIPGTATVRIGAEEFLGSASRLAGNALHEGMHILQGFKGNRITQAFLDWSAQVFPWGKPGFLEGAAKVGGFLPGYAFNPIEVAAQSAGAFSRSVNWIPQVSLRGLQFVSNQYREIQCVVYGSNACR
ncbi:tRNA nuclease WapA [Anaerolineae bacterium]|nr:tRNA nuclease WapA [Anaerolineae bacterium]